MKRTLQLLSLILASALLHAPSASAGLVVTLTPSATLINVGQNAFIDVSITSDDLTDSLDGFFANLSITGGSGLAFVDPQSESFLADSSYVFFGRSGNVIQSSLATVVNSPTSIGFSDFSDDGANAPSPRTLDSTFLLARIDFTGVSAGTFGIEFGTASSFTRDGLSQISFTGPSSITVTAVPEPSSLVLAGIAGVGAVMAKRRRRKVAAS